MRSSLSGSAAPSHREHRLHRIPQLTGEGDLAPNILGGFGRVYLKEGGEGYLKRTRTGIFGDPWLVWFWFGFFNRVGTGGAIIGSCRTPKLTRNPLWVDTVRSPEGVFWDVPVAESQRWVEVPAAMWRSPGTGRGKGSNLETGESKKEGTTGVTDPEMGAWRGAP